MANGMVWVQLMMLVFVTTTVLFAVLFVLKCNDYNIMHAQSRAFPLRTPLAAALVSAATDPSGLLAESRLIEINPFETHIDRVYFINMDHRPDRLAQILEELTRMGVPDHKVQRISGVQDRFGALGCSKAHRNALLDCEAQGYRTCLILEDDFVFQRSREDTWETLNRFFLSRTQWDVVMWASVTHHWENTCLDFMVRVLDAQTTAGYMVHSAFLPALLANVQDGITALEAHSQAVTHACIDQHWKSLQAASEWFVFHPRLGCQRDGLSDIEQRHTSYQDKDELPVSTANFEFLVCVQNCKARWGLNAERMRDLQTLSKRYPLGCYQYLGDPLQSEPFTLHERNRVLTLKCKDDYLNLCHKFGSLLQAIKELVRVNKKWQNLKGIFFTDDDVALEVSKLYHFLQQHQALPYWGHVNHCGITSTYLRHKSEESAMIRAQMAAYPDLVSHAVVLPATTYCSGGGFYLRLDIVLAIAEYQDLFAPFPATQADLNQHRVESEDGQVVYDSQVCVMEDVNIGAAVARLGIMPVDVNVHQIALW